MVVFEMLDRERGSHSSCPGILRSLNFTALQIVSMRWEMISTISPVREAAVSSLGADLLRGIDQNNPAARAIWQYFMLEMLILALLSHTEHQGCRNQAAIASILQVIG